MLPGIIYPQGFRITLVMIAREASSCGIVWETDTAINQGSGVTETLNIPAGNIGQAGKFYLRGELTNSLGQSLGTSYYPFYIIDGDTVLLFNTDKRIYKPGETATITGKVENRAPVMAENLILTLTSNQGGQSPQVLLTETVQSSQRWNLSLYDYHYGRRRRDIQPFRHCKAE